jgi:hypothetical protein
MNLFIYAVLYAAVGFMVAYILFRKKDL